jgi:hypothetical protein
MASHPQVEDALVASILRVLVDAGEPLWSGQMEQFDWTIYQVVSEAPFIGNPTSHLTRMLTPEEIEDLRRDLKEALKFGEEYFKKHPIK